MKKTRDIARLKRWCIRKHGEGVPVNEICTAARLPRRTFYDWWKLYQQHGLEGLQPRSKAPHTVYRVSPSIVEAVSKLRRMKGWSPQLIAGYLRTRDFKVGSMTVYRILRREGLNHPLSKPRVKRTYRRWEREHSNSLWKCDLKLAGDRWLIAIMDDHSRFVTASELFDEGTTENTIWLLDRAVREYSKLEEVLTDHGSVFWSIRRGESRFDAYCETEGIKHILGGIGKPTIQGKIEHWFLRSLEGVPAAQKECALPSYSRSHPRWYRYCRDADRSLNISGSSSNTHSKRKTIHDSHTILSVYTISGED